MVGGDGATVAATALIAAIGDVLGFCSGSEFFTEDNTGVGGVCTIDC